MSPPIRDLQTGVGLTRRRLWPVALGGAMALSGSGARAESVCQDAAPSPVYRPTMQTPLGRVNPKVAWGVHLEGPGVFNAPFIKAIASEEPTVLAIGSGLKFGALHPQSMDCVMEEGGQSVSTWKEADAIVGLAQPMGAAVRGDALIWNDWLPPWLSDLTKTKPKGWRDRLQEAFDTNFKLIFAHFDMLNHQYGKQVMRWCGVVNEPFEAWSLRAGGSPWRTGAWLEAYDAARDGTPGYIAKAFEIAEKYSVSNRPKLYLNEANCENDHFGPVLRPAFLALVRRLKEAGRHIDAVGLESHLMPQWMSDPLRPDWRSFAKFLEDLRALGVEIYITELDVLDCAQSDLFARDRLVADYIRSYVAVAMQSGASMVTNWDFSDNASWYRANGGPNAVFQTLHRWADCSAHPACPRPTIYDQQLAPKMARDALATAMTPIISRTGASF